MLERGRKEPSGQLGRIALVYMPLVRRDVLSTRDQSLESKVEPKSDVTDTRMTLREQLGMNRVRQG
jgi:hypothetical protein